MSLSSLLSLPYELRQQILRLSLTQEGTLELQHPLWTGDEPFRQALFRTCTQLREESLKAFYNGNAFLWIVGADGMTRSDPANYPLIRTGQDSAVVPPVLPWHYPRMLESLRHLHINIYLPDLEDKDAWSTELPRNLSRLVLALDGGKRLQTVKVLFTSKRINTHIALSSHQLDVLNILSRMEVPGQVSVATRYDFRRLIADIKQLNLDKTMRSANT